MCDEYSGLRFRYQDAIADVDNILSLAGVFLTGESIGVLYQFKESLQNARNAACDHPWFLEITEERPIQTIDSRGEYRDSDQAGTAVYGKLSSIWEVRNWDTSRKTQDSFDLVGIASTRLRVFAKESNELVGHWQFEVGDKQSPGSHFHASVNQGGSDGLYPDWLKIPRLPGFLVTPMDALEFLLGELFQQRWLKQVSSDGADKNAWANRQRVRLERQLQWQLNMVRESKTTPWMWLKKSKPNRDVFGNT